MYLKIIFLLLACLPLYKYSKVSGHTVDSLEKVLAGHVSGPQRVDVLIQLSNELMYTDLQKALKYGLDAYDIAIKGSDEEDILSANLTLALIYYFKSDLTKAMEHASRARALSESWGKKDFLARSMDAIGSIYYDIGNQAKSSENFFASLKIYESLNNKDGIGATFCRIGTLYLDQKDYDKAVEYYTKSITIAKEIKSYDGIASNLNNLAKVYTEKQDYPNALKKYQEALDINLKAGNAYLVANNYLNIANVYAKCQEYQIARKKLELARQLFDNLGNSIRLGKCRVLLGEIYFETGDYANSEQQAKIAFASGQSQKFKETTMSSCALLKKISLLKKDSAAAFRYYYLEKQNQDSLFLDEKQKTLSKLELQYQFEKNEQAAQMARQRKNIAIILISGCLVFSLIIIILILKQLKLKAKKLQLEKASHEQEMEFKNKEMVLNVMSLMKKNEMLTELSEKLIRFEKEAASDDSKQTIRKVAGELQKSKEDEIWKEFSFRFKEVHGDFYEKLLRGYPSLTPNELKLCAFLRLNLTSKDIAELTGQRVSSLETARYRLRQKLGIVNSETNLVTFLSSI